MIQVTLNYKLLIWDGCVAIMDFVANHGYMQLNYPFQSNCEDLDVLFIRRGLGFSRLYKI